MDSIMSRVIYWMNDNGVELEAICAIAAFMVASTAMIAVVIH